MRIGIVLHGPEIVDTGSAKKIIKAFKQGNEVMAKLGGTMGRTAVLDAGLEDIIDISRGLKPSEIIIAMKDEIDLAVLLNHGKTLDTGRCFGQIIASRLNIHHPPFIHIERPDCGGRIIYYNPGARQFAEYASKVIRKHYSLPLEMAGILPPCIRTEGNTIIRRISGTFPGENIRLDGIVIGKATEPEPEIVCTDGMVVELRGGKIKPHGIEKLGKIDLLTARVKTGNIRRSHCKPKEKKVVPGNTIGTVAIIDHCAESTFELVKDASIVITVGDDTTAIAADILARLGIPVIGIIDGDLDNVLENTIVPKGSAILRVKPGFDDIVGNEVCGKLLEGRKKFCMKSDEMLNRVVALAEKYIEDIKYY